jgi:O-acetyl-ADP-ribose deacetylase (regulator of RNase III)
MQAVEGSFLHGRVLVVVGDITKQVVTAIVNAANSSLMGGGGVDGAIHLAGGPQILAECQQLRKTTHLKGLPTGEAVLTTAGLLPADYVIHTVGPVYGANNGRDAELLAACYENSLLLAAQNSIASVAFPAISTGIFEYPRDEAAVVSSETIRQFLASNNAIEEVRMVFFAQGDAAVFLENQKFE